MKASEVDKAYTEQTGGFCIRLYKKMSESHSLAFLPCGCDSEGNVETWDLCEPSGKVLYCGFNNDQVDTFAKIFEFEPIKKH